MTSDDGKTNDAISTVEKAFEVFELETARIDPDVYADAVETHPIITEALSTLPGFIKARLAGSFGRKTHALLLKDIDLVIYLNDADGSYFASPSDTLLLVADTLKGCSLVIHAEPKVRAVEGLLDKPYRVDAVPAIAANGATLLTDHRPDDGVEEWSPAHPQGQVDAAIEKNQSCGGNYLPQVRIVRAWNGQFGPNNKVLSSYHAESGVFWALDGPCGHAEATVRSLDYLYEALAPGHHVADPGNPIANVDDRLEDSERLAARGRVGEALDAARTAFEISDDLEAMDAWVKVFGPSFPAPSTDPARVVEGLASGATFAVGTGASITQQGEPFIRPRSWRSR
ncbi:MAG: hypothetical protein QOF13_2202 [Solirubrobacterales bacterium]|jgi:hypothetical protein|nr:hypothetical protein [Solirubrobacterales bacterium]